MLFAQMCVMGREEGKEGGDCLACHHHHYALCLPGSVTQATRKSSLPLLAAALSVFWLRISSRLNRHVICTVYTIWLKVSPENDTTRLNMNPNLRAPWNSTQCRALLLCSPVPFLCPPAEDVPLCSHNIWESHFPFISKVPETFGRLSFACNYQLPHTRMQINQPK